MPPLSNASQRTCFGAEELAVLERVFDQVCFATGTAPDSVAGALLAQALVTAFEKGKKDEHALLNDLVRDFSSHTN
jgi:hypothetical protein